MRTSNCSIEFMRYGCEDGLILCSAHSANMKVHRTNSTRVSFTECQEHIDDIKQLRWRRKYHSVCVVSDIYIYICIYVYIYTIYIYACAWETDANCALKYEILVNAFYDTITNLHKNNIKTKQHQVTHWRNVIVSNCANLHHFVGDKWWKIKIGVSVSWKDSSDCAEASRSTNN